jgi:DNA-binding transcriptional MerR regulator
MLIGEVSARTGLSRRMLRHYDELGLVSPSARSSSGYREYSREDLARLLHVESLRSLGMSLAEVSGALADPSRGVEQSLAELARQTRQRIERERELLAHLEEIEAAGPGDWQGVLAVLGRLGALRDADPRSRQRAVLDADPGVGAEQLVEARIGESETNVAGALDWAIARAGDSALPSLADAARSPDAQVRSRVVGALSALKSPGSTEALRALLDDSEPGIRAGSALELGRRGLPEVAWHLVALVVEGRNDVEAAEILGELASRGSGGSDIAAWLIARLHDPGCPADARCRLTQALAEIPGPDVDEELSELARDEELQVSLTAKAVLAMRGEL